jgi:hypothetical protein
MRHAVAVAAGVSMLAAPLLLLAGGGGGQAFADQVTKKARSAPTNGFAETLHNIALANQHVAAASTTTTSAAPMTTTTVAPTTTTTSAAPAPAPVVASVAVPAPTTTTTAPAPSNTASGIATWYYWNTGQCASPWLPHGTEVTVTNQANGATASCLVTDTEAAGGSHVIDLDTSVFEAIAGPEGLSAGALSVTISW